MTGFWVTVFAISVAYTWAHTPGPARTKIPAVLVALGLCVVAVAFFVS